MIQASKTLFLTTIFISLWGCAVLQSQPRQQASVLSLETADNIQIGIVSSSDIEKKLGKPSFSADFNSGAKQALLYCEEQPCVEGHLTFHVNKSTQLVTSVIWTPQVQDRAITLADLFGHYKKLTFVKQRLLYSYKDYMTLVEKYSNQEHGIVINYNPQQKTITNVVRKDPSTPPNTTASSEKFPVITVLPDRDTASSP